MQSPAFHFRDKALSTQGNEQRGSFTIATLVEKQNLAAWIERSGYSNAEIARRLGCAESTVGHWIKGKSWPTQYEQQLAELFGTTRAGLRQHPERYDEEQRFVNVLVDHPRLIAAFTRATFAELELAIDFLDLQRARRLET